VLLHADHIIPVRDGGEADIDNLITSCEGCNLGKGATPLSVMPQSLSEKAAQVAEREAQIAGYSEIMEAKRERLEDEMWRVADTLHENASNDGFAKADLLSIKRFIERLGFYEVLEAADIAHLKKPFSDNQRWKYFCGVCWKKIRDAEGGSGEPS